MQTSINVSITINYNIYIYITFVLSIIDKFRQMAKGIKTGGRTKGAVNKTTTEIREHFQKLVSDNLEQLDSDLKSLEPLQRLRMVIELSKFVVPTLRATELNTGAENGLKPLVINLGTGMRPEEIREISEALENKY